MSNRRTFLQRFLGLSAGFVAARGLSAQEMQMPMGSETHPKSSPSKRIPTSPVRNLPVVTTDVGDLPFTMDGDTKVFHLIAEPVKQNILPGKTLDLWGFNGSAPGPTIQVNEGDHVRVVFDNHLPEPTSMHWHGFEDRIRYDGQPGSASLQSSRAGALSTSSIFTSRALTFITLTWPCRRWPGCWAASSCIPRTPYQPHCDKDFLIHLQEYAVLPNNTVPNTMNMEYNWLLLNGKAGPANTPLIVRQGDRVRIRFVNLGMDHHPMHLHGHTFYVTGTEGGRIPESGMVARQHRTGWRRSGARDRVCREQSRRLDDPLPSAAPHDEPDVFQCRQDDAEERGMPAGVDMESGMGMLTGTPGAPLGDDYAPSLGRGMGFGATADMATTNGPLSTDKAKAAIARQHAGHAHMSQMAEHGVTLRRTPIPFRTFPQDAYMEGPMMAMDEMVEKPENYGLAPGWSGYMMGMMTFVRVLPPDQYDKVIARMRRANRPNDPYASILSGS